MDIVAAARKFALDEIEKYGTPLITHFELSEKKGQEFAEQLGADKTIIGAGTSLMDVKLGQSIDENRVQEHVAMSVEATEEFLKEFDIDKEKIINCVAAHHGTIPYTCVEAEICANADCYRFIHPKGFFAYLTLLGRRFSEFDTCLEHAEKKMEEKYNILSLPICKEELEPYYQTLKKFIKEARKI